VKKTTSEGWNKKKKEPHCAASGKRRRKLGNFISAFSGKITGKGVPPPLYSPEKIDLLQKKLKGRGGKGLYVVSSFWVEKRKGAKCVLSAAAVPKRTKKKVFGPALLLPFLKKGGVEPTTP